MRRTTLRTLVLTASAVLAVGGAARPAVGQPLKSCPGQQLERPFLPWLDPAWYVFVPDGGLEQGARGWTLGGGARVEAGNEPFDVHAPSDSRSLGLPSGSTATTPWLCVGLEHPTLRLVARSDSLLSVLSVDVLLDDGDGVRALPVGAVPGTLTWRPTLPLALLANATALPLVSDGSVRVALRFRAAGRWHVDDVYVDPFKGT